MYMQRVEEAINALKNGEMIIVMDDEDRENEGDLVYAGIFSDPSKVNFMAQEARGLICVSITQEIANHFELTPMVANNNSNHHTAFTVSIDAKDASTGISAFERDMTIRLLCDSKTQASDFVRPGHIFPLIAKEGGVLVRTGHTEASVDLCKLAGVAPVAVICEIMKEDGSMARRGDRFLFDFAQKHNMKTLYVSDLVEYRLRYENLVQEISREKAFLCGESCEKIIFVDKFGATHKVYCFAQNIQSPYVRFHSIGNDEMLLGNQRSFEAMMNSLEIIKDNGGFFVFLESPNAGDKKNFGIGAQVLKALGVSDFRLLTSRSQAEYVALGGFGVNIIECRGV